MGQYHKVVNLDKREYLHPHKLACGLKLWEQMAAHPGTGAALIALLACSNGRGGGDLDDNPYVGHWAGDRIAIVGDYAEATDLPSKDTADEIYFLCSEPGDYVDVDQSALFTDITDHVCRLIEHELEGKFVGDGWKAWQAA